MRDNCYLSPIRTLSFLCTNLHSRQPFCLLKTQACMLHAYTLCSTLCNSYLRLSNLSARPFVLSTCRGLPIPQLVHTSRGGCIHWERPCVAHCTAGPS